MFYDGELIPMTSNKNHHKIKIIKTVPGNHARKNPYGTGLYNIREIDEITNIIKNQYKHNIGVISPYRYQANLISNRFIDDNLEADTIHKYQGRQKEEIILSFVVNSLDKKDSLLEDRTYDFVTNKQLLNVAITRAKNKVTMIVSDGIYNSNNNIIKDFINYTEYLYGNDVVKTSKVKSIFDILYTEYSDLSLQKFKSNLKIYKSELVMIELIDKVLKYYPKIGYIVHVRLSKIISLQDFKDKERKYLNHPWTHVDFLFYNKVTKQNLFVVEVDGIRYHEQSIEQQNKDKLKDKALLKFGLNVYRFKTNEANEEKRLNNILRPYGY